MAGEQHNVHGGNEQAEANATEDQEISSLVRWNVWVTPMNLFRRILVVPNDNVLSNMNFSSDILLVFLWPEHK
eukprot:CAMPEP_0117050274 /NCGR_PEP_ID=MMETSP0472-20121206/34706_1 /TAXON_ID=693140 ORGANISM="Tiarina fusus, Strain LIS" /NCGR_SAMPLE_ID=MMETSP0472 /ASSEMBLY_ACC=CAM_ASM_000603 /LENGTH=72 /DNA_ID=CAMNT_0004763983 /DNA_START=545 /DNA_END=763 /DNA_ORIENTATION=+